MQVSIKTQDGQAAGHVFHPEGVGPWPAALFYMDAAGPRPELFSMAERLAAQGYYVLLPDLYYRHGSYAPFNLADALKEGPERDRLFGMLRSLTVADMMRDTGAYLDFLGGQKAARAAKVGCVGYCLGGRFAFAAAGTYPDRIAAAASFHGGNLATTQPDSPHLLAGKVRGELYFAVAELDTNFKPEDKERLQNSLDAAGVKYTLEVYPGTRHGFAVKGSPVFDAAASERHWKKLLQLFGTALR